MPPSLFKEASGESTLTKRFFVLVTGMPGSGKSIVVEEAVNLGIPVYVMGDVVREETLKRYGKVTPDLMVKTSRDLREEHGEEVIALRTIERVKPCEKVVVIDGVRSLREVEVFKRYGSVITVAVHSSPKTRFERLLRRKRPGDPSTYEEFYERDMTELRFGLGDVIALADYVVVNEGDIEEAKAKSREIFMKILKEVENSDKGSC
jgi:dephospho-CoA kinase